MAELRGWPLYHYEKACVSAFKDPQRSIPTDQITEGLFWRMYDVLGFYADPANWDDDHACCSQADHLDRMLGSKTFDIGNKARALLDSLKVEQK